MGYQVYHELIVHNDDKNKTGYYKIKNKIEELADIDIFEGEPRCRIEDEWFEEASKAYPSIRFAIRGYGEDETDPDIWQKIYQDGLIHKWQMPKPEFPDIGKTY